MAGNYTFIAVPEQIDEEIILKRFLNKLIEQLDVAFNNRGSGGFTTTDDLSDSSSLLDIIDKVNDFSKLYVTKTNAVFTNEARYKSQVIGSSPYSLVAKGYLEDNYNKNATKNTEQSAIADVAAGADDAASIVLNRNKLNEILVALRASKIISV